MFQHPSEEDERSTRIRPSDFIGTSKDTGLSNFSTDSWNKALKLIPIYSFPNFYVMVGIFLLDSPVKQIVAHFMENMDVFNLYPRECMLRFKALAVAARRSFHYAIGSWSKSLSNNDVMAMFGLCRATGRSDGIPNIEQEKLNRTQDFCPIT